MKITFKIGEEYWSKYNYLYLIPLISLFCCLIYINCQEILEFIDHYWVELVISKIPKGWSKFFILVYTSVVLLTCGISIHLNKRISKVRIVFDCIYIIVFFCCVFSGYWNYEPWAKDGFFKLAYFTLLPPIIVIMVRLFQNIKNRNRDKENLSSSYEVETVKSVTGRSQYCCGFCMFADMLLQVCRYSDISVVDFLLQLQRRIFHKTVF